MKSASLGVAGLMVVMATSMGVTSLCERQAMESQVNNAARHVTENKLKTDLAYHDRYGAPQAIDSSARPLLIPLADGVNAEYLFAKDYPACTGVLTKTYVPMWSSDKRPHTVEAQSTVILDKTDKVPPVNNWCVVHFYRYNSDFYDRSYHEVATFKRPPGEEMLVMPGMPLEQVWYLANRPEVEKRVYTTAEIAKLPLDGNWVFAETPYPKAESVPGVIHVDINGDDVLNAEDYALVPQWIAASRKAGL